MPVTDEDAALQAIATLEGLSDEQSRAVESINQILHNGEPFVDIHDLFRQYDVLYFRGLLVPRVEVLCVGLEASISCTISLLDSSQLVR
jgi:hypothetical protein